VSLPTEQIVIKHELGHLSSTKVFVIPPTISDHNVMICLLQKIRRDYPGAWAVAQRQELEERGKSPLPLAKIKATTREHLGLPAEEPLLQDVPL
jgi:hypothetical protein